MIEVLLKLGGLQAFILIFLLVRKRTNNSANKILAVLVFLLGFSSVIYSFNTLEFYLQYPHFIRVIWGIPLLFGPLIYFYIKRLINKEAYDTQVLLHFLPYIFNLIFLLPFFIQSAEKKIQILDYFTASITGGTDYYYYYNFFLKVIISLISIWYVKKSLKIVHHHRNNLLDEYSNTEKIRLDWLRDILYCFLATSIVFIIVSLINHGDRYPQFDYNVYYYLVLFVLIYIISYKALSQPQIINFEQFHLLKQKKNTPTEFKDKMQSSKKAALLKTFMTSDKPYLNGELTASELAVMLQVSRHELSELLNRHLNRNFYDFINDYRVAEFKHRLGDQKNEHLTLLGIAYDSGFNSKTTFNTIFKDRTGLTPSQYKKSLK